MPRSKRTKHPTAAYTQWWRSVRKSSLSRTLWAGALITLLLYAFLFYRYIVSPYTLRWKALYGDIKVPEGYSIRGIDISHHQGEIDWEELGKATIAGEPIAFAFVKATEGRSLLDENFNENFYQAREQGMLRGAYHYFSPSVPAAEQARFFLRQVHLEDGDLPPVLDIEDTGNLTPDQVRAAARQWLTTVAERYDTKPIIYTYYKFKLQYLNTPEFDQYPYWIAHYYVDKLGYKGAWKFWQHTDCGRLPGIRGDVDCNVYNGSMYDLRKLCIRMPD